MAINAWLNGAIFMSAMVIALFFVRYWRHSRDTLFIYFAIAFVLEGVHRLLQAWPADDPDTPQYYLLRLLEYGLILVAIVKKNRGAGKER
ncbi:hypothetical protein GM658_04875 [Pseudoduganella eburnea]|jgi:hypothetical protein|uniref:Uncharacterized protein n=1 Tax=Massilia eburnea TaxID=1776165 RepID=A0A6L6QE43_9BURK|nr:DUF5985 family protein [Massilia eburnea]MTW09926.1 hypothetical protein [Massilia eburnea]